MPQKFIHTEWRWFKYILEKLHVELDEIGISDTYNELGRISLQMLKRKK